MTWDSLDWRPLDAATLDGVAALVDLAPMLSSALDESVSALAMAPISLAAPSVAEVAAVADLPVGFVAVATFELLGTARRPVLCALEPASGDTLGGATVQLGALAAAVLDGIDGGIAALVGEGVQPGPADAAALGDEGLLLVRLPFRGVDGVGVDLVAAVDRAVPVELATHVVALQALGGEAASAPSPAVAPSPVAAPVAAPAAPSLSFAPPVAPAAPAGVAAPVPGPAHPQNVRPLHLEELPASGPATGGHNIELLLGVNLQVTVEIGRTKLPIRDVLSLTPGSIVELDKLAGEKVDVLVNGHQIASGEVVVVDENFGVRITDVVSRQRRLMSADGAA